MNTVAPGMGDPVGDVEFFLDGVSLGIGTATQSQFVVLSIDGGVLERFLTVPDLGVGDHEFEAVFSGSLNFKTSTSGPQEVTMQPATPIVTVNATPDSVFKDTDVTVSATVTVPDSSADALIPPTGKIQFYVNGEPYLEPIDAVDGKASVVWPSGVPERVNMTAMFLSAGDEYANAYSNAVTVTVTVKKPAQSLADSGIGTYIPVELAGLMILAGWVAIAVGRSTRRTTR